MPLVGDVVDAGAHDEALRDVAGLDERPEVLTRQVGGERHPLVVAPGAGRRLLVGDDGRADGDELGEVVAVLLELDLESHTDDPVRAERVGLGLHAGHRELAGVVHRLAQLLEFHVLAPLSSLDAHMVDAGAEDEADGPESRLPDEEELVHRQVGGEQPRAAVREAGPCVAGQGDAGERVGHGGSSRVVVGLRLAGGGR
jgi:hypothetical protein